MFFIFTDDKRETERAEKAAIFKNISTSTGVFLRLKKEKKSKGKPNGIFSPDGSGILFPVEAMRRGKDTADSRSTPVGEL